MRSLRTRLILATTLATLAIYLVASAILFAAIRRSQLAELDSSLTARAMVLMALAEQSEKGQIKLDIEPDQLSKLAADRSDEGFALLSSEGKIAARSLSLPDVDWPAIAQANSSSDSHGFLHGAFRARFIIRRFSPRSEEEEHPLPASQRKTVTLIVARDTHLFDAKMREFLWLLAAVFGLTVIVSAAIMAFFVRQGLAPLNTLARSLEPLGDGDLARRVTLRNPPAELQPVVERLNELLARVESAFDRERAFTADVAHELRTPLAGLTTALEVTASMRRAPEEYELIISKCLGATRGMRSMVENLLTLARVEARQMQPQNQSLNAGNLMQSLWTEFAPRAAERRLIVNWSIPENFTASIDRGLFETVLRNLFDNAVTYANDGGTLAIAGRTDGTTPIIDIRNSGSAIAAADAPRVFDRFWRGDSARSAIGQHCGMGLALCQRIMLLLGGSITAETTLGGDFRITLRLNPQ